MEKIFKGNIENWCVFWDHKDNDPHFHLIGNINGKERITSRVLSIVDGIAETRNSFYKLGWPRDNYYDVLARYI